MNARPAALLLTLLLVAPSTPPVPAVTATGIPLDAAWKVRVYELARAKFVHPAWGWQHSERNYRLAMDLARADGLRVDTDVLFAAAFLHDMAAFMPCADTHLEHGACAAQQSPALLRAAGFPMRKIAAVQEAERGHMYYANPGTDPTAIVLHDADSLDFLGDVGAARMIALMGAKSASFAPALRTLRTLLREIPPRLITRAARRIGAQRAAELHAFLAAIATETRAGKAI